MHHTVYWPRQCTEHNRWFLFLRQTYCMKKKISIHTTPHKHNTVFSVNVTHDTEPRIISTPFPITMKDVFDSCKNLLMLNSCVIPCLCIFLFPLHVTGQTAYCLYAAAGQGQTAQIKTCSEQGCIFCKMHFCCSLSPLFVLGILWLFSMASCFFCIYEAAKLLVSSGEHLPALRQGVGACAGASLICSDTSQPTVQDNICC